MSRVIKFRAWDKEAKEMREVAMLRWEDGRMSRIAGYWKGTRNNGWTDYDPADGKYELMQFTGLTDRNGKEIYEGSILSLRFVVSEPWEEPFDNVQVIFEDAAFKLVNKNQKKCTLGSDLAKIAKVIGNIYENPELLK